MLLIDLNKLACYVANQLEYASVPCIDLTWRVPCRLLNPDGAVLRDGHAAGPPRAARPLHRMSVQRRSQVGLSVPSIWL